MAFRNKDCRIKVNEVNYGCQKRIGSHNYTKLNGYKNQQNPMKNSTKLLILLFLFYQSSYSQLKIVDDKTGEAVAFAHLIIEGGKSGAISDINGIAPISEIEKRTVNLSSMITIQHLGYDNLEISLKELKQLMEVRLKEREILLSDICVTPKDYDYVVLTGYFRSYQLDDRKLKYYTDGMVAYYFPRKGRKFQINLLAHRSFRNQTLIDQMKKRSATLVMVTAGIPYMDGNTILTDLDKKYTFSDTSSGLDILKNNSKVGYIKLNSDEDKLLVNIDKILPAKEEVHSLLGYTSRIQHSEVTENYLTDDIQNLRMDNLESCKKYREIFYSHKKDSAEVIIEGIDEFYVMERKYVTKKETKGIKFSSFSGLRESHLYTDEYWKELLRHGIPPLSRQIEDELNNVLTMY